MGRQLPQLEELADEAEPGIGGTFEADALSVFITAFGCCEAWAPPSTLDPADSCAVSTREEEARPPVLPAPRPLPFLSLCNVGLTFLFADADSLTRVFISSSLRETSEAAEDARTMLLSLRKSLLPLLISLARPEKRSKATLTEGFTPSVLEFSDSGCSSLVALIKKGYFSSRLPE